TQVFASLLYTHGGELWDPSNGVVIDSEAAQKAASLYRKFIDAGIAPRDMTSWDFTKVMNALEAGTVAMAGPYWNSAYGQIQLSDIPHSEVAIAPVPGVLQADGTIRRVAYTHGWGLVINP